MAQELQKDIASSPQLVGFVKPDEADAQSGAASGARCKLAVGVAARRRMADTMMAIAAANNTGKPTHLEQALQFVQSATKDKAVYQGRDLLRVLFTKPDEIDEQKALEISHTMQNLVPQHAGAPLSVGTDCILELAQGVKVMLKTGSCLSADYDIGTITMFCIQRVSPTGHHPRDNEAIHEALMDAFELAKTMKRASLMNTPAHLRPDSIPKAEMPDGFSAMVFRGVEQMLKAVVDAEEASLRQDRDALNKVSVRGEKDLKKLLRTLGETMEHSVAMDVAMKIGHGIVVQAQDRALAMARNINKLATVFADLAGKCEAAAEKSGDHDDGESDQDSAEDEFDDDE